MMCRKGKALKMEILHYLINYDNLSYVTKMSAVCIKCQLKLVHMLSYFYGTISENIHHH